MKFRYVFLDLSKTLINSQRALNKVHRECKFVQSDASRLAIKDNTLDILIANECIADFAVIKLGKEDILREADLRNKHKGEYLEAINKFKKYVGNMDNLTSYFIFPLGIVYFLEEIRRVLKKGALAVLVEYGDFSYKSRLIRLGGHFEYAVDFNMVKSIAQKMGFKIEVRDIYSFLEIKDIPLLSLTSRVFLKKFLRSKGRILKRHFYTRKILKEELGASLEKIKNLEFVNTKKMIDDFDPTYFKVLLLYN